MLCEPKLKGTAAEELAVQLHHKARFEILARNYRVGAHEIDIIAKRGNIVHFVEVKYRKTIQDANRALSQKQFQRIAQAALKFMEGRTEFMQFDALLVDQKLQWERIDNIMIS